MGASADQIEREIRETRERMDGNLDVLRERAASNALRYGRIAAIALIVTGAGVAGFVLYRRLRRPSLQERLEDISPQALRELAVEFGARVKEKFPSVTVTVNERKEPEPGPLHNVLRKVAPTLIGSASSAVIQKMTRRSAAGVETSRRAYD